MKLLTFLGTSKYSRTTYVWQEREQITEYVAEALNRLFEVDVVKVFLTKKAREIHWESFRDCILNSEDIPIPSGESEEELWQIFEAVVNSVETGDRILLDVTHSFRSIPFFVFLAGIYLQKSRNVTIQGVYYGAYERNRERTPIFDLTPTLKFVDWLTATEKFLDTGSATDLGQLLSTIQSDFYKQGRQKREPVKPEILGKFGTQIKGISDSIELVRPLKLMEETAFLQKLSYDRLKEDVGAFAQPFALLLDRIQADYGQFALSNSRDADPKQALVKQMDLLRWYVKKSLYAQAILLGREWVVSALCVGLERDYLEPNERQQIERGLNELVAWTQEHSTKPLSINALGLVVQDLANLASFWSKLRDIRNDLAHTEMRRDSLSASKMTQFVEKNLLQELENLFVSLLLLDTDQKVDESSVIHQSKD